MEAAPLEVARGTLGSCALHTGETCHSWQKTLLHCYISAGSGQTRLSSHGKIEIMFAGGFWFEFEQHLNQLYTGNRHVVWAIFDCDRTRTPTSNSKIAADDEDLSEEENATIITYVSAGSPTASFTERLEMYFTKFFNDGQGSFNLTTCLDKIPVDIARTEFSFVPFNVGLRGEKPKDRTWSGSVN